MNAHEVLEQIRDCLNTHPSLLKERLEIYSVRPSLIHCPYLFLSLEDVTETLRLSKGQPFLSLRFKAEVMSQSPTSQEISRISFLIKKILDGRWISFREGGVILRLNAAEHQEESNEKGKQVILIFEGLVK